MRVNVKNMKVGDRGVDSTQKRGWVNQMTGTRYAELMIIIARSMTMEDEEKKMIPSRRLILPRTSLFRSSTHTHFRTYQGLYSTRQEVSWFIYSYLAV